MSRISVEEIAGFLRTVADKLGTTAISQKVYDEHRPPTAPSSRTVIRTVGSWVDACAAAGLEAGSPTPTIWTSDLVVAAIRKAAKDTGEPVLLASYERWRADQANPLKWPTSVAIRNLDPDLSWVDWCDKANVEGAYKVRPTTFSDKELVKVLKAAASDAGKPLTETKYAAWADSRAEAGDEQPHQRTFPARFGSWRKALAAAGLKPARPEERLDTLEAVAQAIQDLQPDGRLRTAAYAKWAAKKPERPSLSTVSRYPGGWSAVVRAASTRTSAAAKQKQRTKTAAR